jgi:glycogen(starch) synthase
LEWMDRPWADLARAGEWLLDMERRVKPDIVHLNCYVPAALPFRSPKLVVGHSCVLSWWQAVHSEPAPSEWNWYRYRVTRGLRAADLVIAPSHAMLDALQRHYGPLSDAEVIPNGRDPQIFTPLHKEEFVLIAGRLWDPAKNLEAVVQVASELPWPVYAAGECKHPDGKTITLKNVQSLGWLSAPALVPWYGRASIYVLPARYEPFGLSVLEAGLSGCALVLGDIPSLRGIWEEAAMFVPPNDRMALKSALIELMSHPQLRHELGARARRRALEFSPSRMAAGYLSAYADLMMTKVPQATESMHQMT